MTTPDGYRAIKRFLGLIGVMAGALSGFLGVGGPAYYQAAFISGAVAVTAVAGAHFTD